MIPQQASSSPITRSTISPMKRVRNVVGVFFVLFAVHAIAGPYEDGIAAFDAGQFATALALWMPLAEHGNAAAQFNVAVSVSLC